MHIYMPEFVSVCVSMCVCVSASMPVPCACVSQTPRPETRAKKTSRLKHPPSGQEYKYRHDIHARKKVMGVITKLTKFYDFVPSKQISL